MNTWIHPDMRIDHLLEHHPNTRAVFEAHGLGRLATEVSLGVVGPFLTLQTALMSNSVSTDLFVQILNDFCREESPPVAPNLAKARRQGPVNLLTLLPYEINAPFSKALSAFIEKSDCQDGKSVNCTVESDLNYELSYSPYVNHLERLDTLPDIIVSAEFNPFFHQRFYRRFVQPGYFVDTMQKTPNVMGGRHPSQSVRVIWPADGALASPITLMVKREKAQRSKPISDYLTSKAMASIFAGAYFPSPHPAAHNRMPVGAGLKWLGWDYIRATDLETANAEIDRVFLPGLHQRRSR